VYFANLTFVLGRRQVATSECVSYDRRRSEISFMLGRTDVHGKVFCPQAIGIDDDDDDDVCKCL